MVKTKACPICGKKMKAEGMGCCYKCFRILERVNKTEGKAHIDVSGKKKKEPWYLSYFGLSCIAWIIIGILALIFAPQLIFLVLHG